jgi:hypothetical protein
MIKIAITNWRAELFPNGYVRTRWLVMTATALATFLGFQFIDQYIFGP